MSEGLLAVIEAHVLTMAGQRHVSQMAVKRQRRQHHDAIHRGTLALVDRHRIAMSRL